MGFLSRVASLYTVYTENIKIILTFAFFRSRQSFLSTFRHLLQDARSMSDFCQKRRMWLRSLQSFKTNTDFVMCLRKWVQKLFEIPATCILFGWNTYHVDWTFTGKSSLFLISINQKSRHGSFFEGEKAFTTENYRWRNL
jgi:hypothetical protein